MGVVKKNSAPAEKEVKETKAPAKAAAPKAEKAEKPEVVKVSRKQLALAIQEKVKAAGKAVPSSIAEIMVVAYEESVIEALASGAEVNLPGFGKFIAKDKPAGEKRNPATGEMVMVAAHKQVRFRVGAGLKKAVNGGAEAADDADDTDAEGEE